MMRYVLTILVTLLTGTALAATVTKPYSIIVTTGPTAPHDYYVSAKGNDANDGSAAHPWLTAKHPVDCGDTLHLVPLSVSGGAYVGGNFDHGKWGVVSNCPSSTGRNTALIKCDGPHQMDCPFLGVYQTFRVDSPHWAVQGMYCNANQAMFSTCFAGEAAYVIFISNYGNALGAGTGTQEYTAQIGTLVYGGAFGGGPCFSGLSIFKPVQLDADPTTHIFVAGSFYINNTNMPGCSDGEGIIIDTWTANNYKGKVVFQDNIIIGNGSFGLEELGGNGAPVIFRNNTMYGNGLAAAFEIKNGVVQTPVAEISIKEGNSNIVIDKNLIHSLAGWPAVSGIPATPAVDIYYAHNVTISNSFIFSPINKFGLDGYTAAGVTLGAPYLPTVINVTKGSPNFVNPHKLTAAPDCSQVSTTVQCMAQLIADFKPQAAGTAGFGYQPPGPCAPNPDWPTWIGPGDVPDGIITKPCGM